MSLVYLYKIKTVYFDLVKWQFSWTSGSLSIKCENYPIFLLPVPMAMLSLLPLDGFSRREEESLLSLQHPTYCGDFLPCAHCLYLPKHGDNNFFFFFWPHLQHAKVPAQGWNLHYNYNQNNICDNAISLTHWAIRVLFHDITSTP